MKLWRKLAKKRIGDDGQEIRNGRQIKRMMQQFSSKNIRVTNNGSISVSPQNEKLNLLETLFVRAGIESKKEVTATEEEATDATI